MRYQKSRRLSIFLSVLLHGTMLLLFWAFRYDVEYPVRDFVEISFGTGSSTNSAGATGTELDGAVEELTDTEQKKTEDADQSIKEVKEVELPPVKNTDETNPVVSAKKEKKEKEVKETRKDADTKNDNATTSDKSKGNKTSGDGSFGFDIDWGGSGMRKLLTNPPVLPDYPAGVLKEIDIRIKFTIQPDGTVGSVRLLTKADTQLENAAIDALRNWRFEPLNERQKQSEQTAIIVFPYRLE